MRSNNYRRVEFVNLSMCSLGVFSYDCPTFLEMMSDIGIDKKQQHHIIKKMINLAIRVTHFIFYSGNKIWDSPGYHAMSSSQVLIILLLPILDSKTNKVFIIIIIIIIIVIIIVISTVMVFNGVHYVHQLGASHTPI